MQCPECGKPIVADQEKCPHCGSVLSRKENNVRPRRFSKGGFIATAVMTALCTGALLQSGFDLGVFLAYLLANVVLLLRSFRLPLKWWQGILVWIGALVMGASFSALVGPPTFEEQALGVEAPLSARIGPFIVAFLIGTLVVLLGTFRRKQ